MAKKKKILRPYYCKVCKQLAESEDRSRDICYAKSCEERWEERGINTRRRFSSSAYNSGSISGASLIG